MKDETTTPGPWHAAYDEGGYWVILDSDKENVFDNDCVYPEAAEANAKLAASAPILKELVEKQEMAIEMLVAYSDMARVNGLFEEIEQLKAQL